MSDGKISNPEGLLLNLMDELSSLAWRKYQSRYPEVWDGKEMRRADHSDHPPFVCFRFEKEDPALIERLKLAVDGYNGGVKWGVYSHQRIGLPGTNWMICPQFMEENNEVALGSGLSVSKYMAKFYPEFGPMAYDDMGRFYEYMCSCFLSRSGN